MPRVDLTRPEHLAIYNALFGVAACGTLLVFGLLPAGLHLRGTVPDDCVQCPWASRYLLHELQKPVHPDEPD